MLTIFFWNFIWSSPSSVTGSLIVNWITSDKCIVVTCLNIACKCSMDFLWFFTYNTYLALWMLLGCCLMISLVCMGKSAENLLVALYSNEGCWPIVNFKCENPCTFWREFLTFTHHTSAITKPQQFTSRTFVSTFDSTKMCHSTMPLDEGDSSLVVYIT